MGRITARLATELIACILALSSCYDSPPDPREVFGLQDALNSDLLPEVEEAIEVANTALAVEGRFLLIPNWKPGSGKRGVQGIAVYFLRRPGLSSEIGIAKTKEVLDTFRTELAQAELPSQFENCTETDPCAAQMYAHTHMARLTTDLYQSSSAVDSAATESDCRCVMLIEDDLLKFRLIFGPSINNGKPIVPLTWYVPWYALHEVGHPGPQLPAAPQPGLGSPLRTNQSALNEQQKEEMRADAYAATILRKACFVQTDREVREAVSQACLGLAIQSLQFWFYGIFDKTDTGLRRQYLNDGRTHPNALMRLLAMNVVMSDGGDKPVELLKEFLDKREIFSARFVRPATPN